MAEGTQQLTGQAASATSGAVTAFGVVALVLAVIGLVQCVLWAFGILSPWLPDATWLWITLHGLEWWAIGIGALGPLVAGCGAVLGGVIAFVAKLGGLRARHALLAVAFGLAGIAVFAAAWVATSLWVPGV